MGGLGLGQARAESGLGLDRLDRRGTTAGAVKEVSRGPGSSRQDGRLGGLGVAGRGRGLRLGSGEPRSAQAGAGVPVE